MKHNWVVFLFFSLIVWAIIHWETNLRWAMSEKNTQLNLKSILGPFVFLLEDWRSANKKVWY